MDNSNDVVQRIKEANPIEDVIADCGYKFQKEGGKYWRVPHEGGLVVNVVKQRFFWAAKGWNGDCVEFLMQERGWEFKTAVEWLADRANLERPTWGKTDENALKAFRLRLSVFEIAQGLFQEWLWDDAEALKYLREERAFRDEIICGDVTAKEILDENSPYKFSDETVKKAKEAQDKSKVIVRGAGFGFSGRKTPEQYSQMRKQFDLYGIAHDCPQAVTILGFQGKMADWADKWGIDRVSKDWDKSWETKGRLHGMMITPGIVYAHHWGGRVIYLSRRQLPGHDLIREENGDKRPWKSFNPQVICVGNRHPYFNSVYRPDAADCVIVEGPADAETFAQWGIAAVALCGVSVDDDGVGALKGMLKKHKRLYLALDDDKAGNKKREAVAMAFGALIRLVDWANMVTDDKAETETTEANNGE